MLLYFVMAVTTTPDLHKFANFIYAAIQSIYVVCSCEPELRFPCNSQKVLFSSKEIKFGKKVINQFEFWKFYGKITLP